MRSCTTVVFTLAALLAPLGASAADKDPVAVANKADVLHDGLKGAALTAVHEVTDTAGKTEKQVYRVLNDLGTGNSFIVISSENSEVNGMVYLIKGGTLYAATPNQRSFQRLGSLNLDRRVSGSLFSHWDLQGNIPIGTEYTPTITKSDASATELELQAKAGSHYKKIVAKIDGKTGLYVHTALYDDKGLLKTVEYSKPKTVGSKVKRKMMTHVEMARADGRGDVPVAKTTFKLVEVELDPEVSYADELASSDANLQRLRSKYVLSGDALRSLLAEAE
jgi:outer membrane lipoprotein-sorting protein